MFAIRFTYLFLLLTICFRGIYAQNKTVDSLKYWLKTHTKPDSQRAVTLHKLSYRLSEINVSESYLYADEAQKLALQIGNNTNLGQSYINFAILAAQAGQFSESQQHYKKAFELFEQTGWVRGQSICLNNMAENYEANGQLEESLNTIFKALEINQKINEKRGQAINYEQISDLYLKLNKPEKSFQYVQKGLALADKQDLSYPQLLLTLAKNYIAQKNYTKAEETLKQVLDFAQKNNEKLLEINAQKAWASLYSSQNQHDNALIWLNKSLASSKAFGSAVEQSNIHKELSKVYFQAGDYKKALENEQAFQVIFDTLQLAKHTELIKYADIKQKAIEHEKEYEILKDLKVVQEKELNRQAIWLGSFGVAIALLLAGLGFMLYRNRLRDITQKQKEQAEHLKQIELSERIRTEIARDLHDDLGATLSGISMLSSAAQKYLDNENPNKVDEILGTIGSNSLKMVGNIREIIWTSKQTSETVEQVSQRMRLFAAEILDNLGVKYDFRVADDLLNLRLPSNMQYHLYLIFKELVSNIAQHSGAKNVWIDIFKSNDQIHLTVEDDGQGFELDTARNKGNGLFNIEKRAENLGGTASFSTSKAKGSHTEISLPKP